MQLYQSNHRLMVIQGSRSHHFNKRRLKKVAHQFIIPSLQSTDKIDKFMKAHHIKIYDYYGGYSTKVSKHRLQFYFTQSTNDEYNRNQSYHLEKALKDGGPENYWIDNLLNTIKHLVISPKCTSVDELINFLFKCKGTITVTHNGYGQKLQFWRFEMLSSKYPFEISTQWFSQMYDQHLAWTDYNIRYCLKHDDLSLIKRNGLWLPETGASPLIFILWGEHGANQKMAQKYLTEQYHIYPLILSNVLDKKSLSGDSSVVVYDLSSLKKITKKYSHNVVSIDMKMPNQRTVFKHLLKVYSYQQARQMIMSNKDLQHTDINDQLISHSIVIYGNRLKNIFNKLDSLVSKCYMKF